MKIRIILLLTVIVTSLIKLIDGSSSNSNDLELPRLVVQTDRPVRVASGRTVSLTSEHLRVNVDSPALMKTCKIVVLRGVSFTERGGYLSPGVFSCLFSENNDRVTYTHSGSPLATNDSISLRIFAFGNFSGSPIIRDVTLNVEVTVRPNDKLVLFGAAKGGIECVLSGLSEDFDRLRMAFSYDIADNVTCTLTYNATGATFPAKGQLVDKFGKTVNQFSIDCWEFAFAGMRYRHLKPFSPSIDYIPLTARVTDGGPLGRVIEEENVFIPIRIIGALDNYAPQVLASSALKLVLKSPYLTLFTSEVLSFVDWDVNDVSRLVVNITQQPPISLGHFVNLLRPTERITSFTVGDVATKLIAFQPAPRTGSDSPYLAGSGEARFVAFDELFARSEQVTVQISLSYSSSSFPKARVREALYVLRGQPQPITMEEIEFISNSKENMFKKPQIQRIFFEKPKCGKILLKKLSTGVLKETSSFSLNDLTNQVIIYNQTSLNNCSSDFIVVHIQDDFVELRLGLPVYIVPKATEPPILVTARQFVVRQALQFVLNRQSLFAIPADNSTEGRCRRCVTYRVVKQPKFGTLESASNASLGNVLTEFTQSEVDDGLIRYQHNGVNDYRDEIVLRLEDDDSNIGSRFVVPIQVKPYSPEKISSLLTNSNVATLNESDFLILSEKHLKYKYQAASDREIEYVVVRPPYFLETGSAGSKLTPHNQAGDAGKIVIFSSGNMPARRSSEQVIAFTQSDVKDGRVAYFAPNTDIGSRARVAQFVFDVKGPEGVAKAQVFKINILPINNRPPRVHETTLSVKAGESVGLLPALQVDDADSPLERLTIAVEQTPRHGDLVINGTERLSLGDKIDFEQLSHVEYKHHPHSPDRVDTFRLMAFDGQYHSSGTISIAIQQPDVLDKIFISNAEISENEQISLTVNGAQEFIGQRFPGNATMKFLIVRPPFHGKLLLNDREIRKFYSRDLINGRLVFSHPPQVESGMVVFEDSLTILGISTSADLILDSHQLLLRTISIKIHPKDNRPPRFEIIGMPQLLEGQSVKIDGSMIVVDDVDSPSDNLRLEIVTLPKFGCLSLRNNDDNYSENSSSCISTGQKINVTEFRLGEIFLSYNHTVHNGNEATSDSFEIRASDGLHQSQVKVVSIEILPETDEIPAVELTKPTPFLEEGGEIELSQLFTVSDLDKPAENLTLIFTQFPQFGSITMQRDDGHVIILNNLNNKTVQFQLTGKQPVLTYRHDGSENSADSFSVQVSDDKFSSKPTQIDVKIEQVDDEKPQLTNRGRENSGEIFRLVSENDKKIALASDDISIEDEDTEPGGIVYTLIEKPSQLTLMVDNVIAVSFTQADIDRGRVNLMLPANDFSVIVDNFRLSALSGERKFEIPDIGLSVKVVKENALNFTTPLNSENIDKPLDLNLTELEQLDPAGLVLISINSTGQDCFSFTDSSFTLDDVKSGKIRVIPGLNFIPLAACQKLIRMEVRHLPSVSVIGRVLVNFTAVKVEEKKPEITYDISKKPGVIERLAKRVFGFVLTTEHIHAVANFGDGKRKLEDAIYEVSRDPTYGILADLSATSSSLDSLRTFSQQQIDAKQIVYVLTKLVHTMTNDSFDFSVLDGSTRRQLLENQHFDVEWSFVEFEQDQLVACEHDGFVRVPVRRVGFTNSSASVQIRIRQPHHDDRSDKEHMETVEEELKFVDGATKLMFNVKIDGETDQTRMIRALLRTPINTLLGSSRKVSIRVVSSNKAPCNNSRTTNSQHTSLISPVESLGSLSESRRVFNLRSKMLEDDEDGKENKRPSRSNKSCQTGWLPLQSLGKTCYAQLPLATHYWDAHRRCKALGGRLPTASTMSPAILRELFDISSKKPIWVDAPHLTPSKKADSGNKHDQIRSCAVIRNMAIALRRCSVAKARVVCITDL